MVLMTEGMTFILHHSSDLGDGDEMGVEEGKGFKIQFRNFTRGHSTLIYKKWCYKGIIITKT